MTSNYSIHAITWNVGESDPPSDIAPLFEFSGNIFPNIYVIGLQELRSTSLSMLADSLFNDPWTIVITQHLATNNYIRLKSLRMMGTHLSVYIQRDDLKHVTNLQFDYTRTAYGGLWGSKGAISLSLEIFGVNLCFVNCHFSAHLSNCDQRIQNYNQIILSQKFENKEAINILDHDYVFWIGDTNFRFDDVDRPKVVQLVAQRDYQQLYSHDQLMKSKRSELVFIDFVEGNIDFPPTYKYDYGTDDYDTSSKNRIPAWCDRILWRVQEDAYEGVKLNVKQHSYTSVQQLRTSDHKPVVASFTVQVLSQTPSDVRVIFEPLGEWDTNLANQVDYTIPNGFQKSTNDWIALYSDRFVSLENYGSFVWACVVGGRDMGDDTQLFTVTFDRPQFVGLTDGYYQLIYHSYINKCPAGISGPLKLVNCQKPRLITEGDDSDVDGPNYSDMALMGKQTSEKRLEPRQEMDLNVQNIRHSLTSKLSGDDDISSSEEEMNIEDVDSEDGIEEADGEFRFVGEEEAAVSMVRQSDQHAYLDDYERLREEALRERNQRVERKGGEEGGEESIRLEEVTHGESFDLRKPGEVEEAIEQELMERNLGGFSKAVGIKDEEQEVVTRTAHKMVNKTADDEASEDECVEVKQTILLTGDEVMHVKKESMQHAYQDEYESLRDAAIAEREARAEARERALLEGGEIKVVTSVVESTMLDESVVAEVEKQLLSSNLNDFDKLTASSGVLPTRDVQVKKQEEKVGATAPHEDQTSHEEECVALKQTRLQNITQSLNDEPHANISEDSNCLTLKQDHQPSDNNQLMHINQGMSTTNCINQIDGNSHFNSIDNCVEMCLVKKPTIHQ